MDLWKEEIFTGFKIELGGFIKGIIMLWFPVTGRVTIGIQRLIWSSGGKKTVKENKFEVSFLNLIFMQCYIFSFKVSSKFELLIVMHIID